MNAFEWVLAFIEDGKDLKAMANKENRRIMRGMVLYGALAIISGYEILTGVNTHGYNSSTVKNMNGFERMANEEIEWRSA